MCLAIMNVDVRYSIQLRLMHIKWRVKKLPSVSMVFVRLEECEQTVHISVYLPSLCNAQS